MFELLSKMMALPTEMLPVLVRAPAVLPCDLALTVLALTVTVPDTVVSAVPSRRSAKMTLSVTSDS